MAETRGVVILAIRILTLGSDSLGNQHLNFKGIARRIINGKTDQEFPCTPFPWFHSVSTIRRPLGMKHNPRKRGGTIYSRPTATGPTTEQPEASICDVDSTQPLAMAGVFTYPNVDKADMESSWVSENVSVCCCELTIRTDSQMSLLWVIFMIFMALSRDGFSSKGLNS